MKRSLLDRAAWAVAGALAVALIGSLAGVVRGGPLDPPGPPASTAPLVEPRTPIRQPASAADFPIVLSQPGSYYLAENITGVSGKDGIWIAASGVTLDLNGFVLDGVPGSGNGIVASAFDQNTSIRHGTVRGWGGAGINGDFLFDGTYEDLRLKSNLGGGIRVTGISLISRVVATDNGQHGILINNLSVGGKGGIIRDSTAEYNTLDGIQVLGFTLVVDNTAIGNGGFGIHLYHSGNRIDSNNVGANTTGAIKVEDTNNVIVRNSIRGVNTDVSVVAGNTVGPLESAGTPIGNPWANIVY
jgi:parallel beta-helix repeat protein